MHSPHGAAASLTRLVLWPINLFRRGVRLGLSTLEILLAALGAVAALVVTALLTPALNQLPGAAGDFAPIGVAILLVPTGMAVALGRRPEVERFFRGVRERTDTVTGAIAPAGSTHGARSTAVVDTSAIIDGRLADIVESGFLLADLVVPRFVLDELRRVADSSDPLKRRRGRHGLELLSRIQADTSVHTVIDERDFPEAPDVDAKVLALTRDLGAVLLTTDFNLTRVAGVEDLPVLNINALAQAVRTVALPGERLRLAIHQVGRERRQGVGFLADGTMVVVEEARDLVGREVDVEVQRVIQTAAGRMLFAELRPPDPEPDDGEAAPASDAETPAGAPS
ncbi:MAG: PIN domain nuclease [Chloroflexi bacterium]|nr:PIN domain nuclease [Chloroflexota bacterium]